MGEGPVVGEGPMIGEGALEMGVAAVSGAFGGELSGLIVDFFTFLPNLFFRALLTRTMSFASALPKIASSSQSSKARCRRSRCLGSFLRIFEMSFFLCAPVIPSRPAYPVT